MQTYGTRMQPVIIYFSNYLRHNHVMKLQDLHYTSAILSIYYYIGIGVLYRTIR